MCDPAARRRLRAATSAATLVLVVGGFTTACGAAEPPAVAAPAKAAPSGANGTPSEPDPGSASSTAPSPNVGSPATSTGDRTSDQQFCQAISLNLAFLTTAATSPDDPTLDQGLARIRQLSTVAPAQLGNDLTVIADFDQHVLDQLRAGRRPEIKETPELTSALSDEAKWTAAHC
jgi:hypothetical protein